MSPLFSESGSGGAAWADAAQAPPPSYNQRSADKMRADESTYFFIIHLYICSLHFLALLPSEARPKRFAEYQGSVYGWWQYNKPIYYNIETRDRFLYVWP